MASKHKDVYYNEFDIKTALWLEELSRCGLISDGVIDARDIRNVKSEEVKGYKRCHWFAGIGGWEEALRLAGWPATRSIWTASCPCQPFSVAGKQKGEEDERHLWPVLAALIRQCKPDCVIGEQVSSKDGYEWIDGVRSDLEAEGYTFGAADLPAASQGSPHIRNRLFWVAVAGRECIRDTRQPPEQRAIIEQYGYWPGPCPDCGQPSCSAETCSRVANAIRCGRDGRAPDKERQQEQRTITAGAGETLLRGRLADHEEQRRPQRLADGRGGAGGIREEGDGSGLANDGGPGRLENSNSGGQQECPIPVQRTRKRGKRNIADSDGGSHPGRLDSSNLPGCGEYGGAIADGAEHIAAERAGDTLRFWDSYRLIPCKDGKFRRIPRDAEPGVLIVADGLPAGMDACRLACQGFPLAGKIPNRVGLLRGAGNAIVPQVAAAFIRTFLEVEHEFVS